MRLIDAECDELMETVGRKAFNTRQDIRDWLDSAPTVDAVPVIRCKDCRFLNDTLRLFGGKRYCHKHNSEVTEDGFCNFAEQGEQNMDFPSAQKMRLLNHPHLWENG